MKLTVEILRHESGCLQAYVVQQGRRGADILNGRRIRKVDSARMQAGALLCLLCGIVGLSAGIVLGRLL